jgi:hypothetical protein
MHSRGNGSQWRERFSAVNEFIGSSPFAVHDGSRAPRRTGLSANGFGLMRKRLVAWTILTSALLAVTVWIVLGPPEHASGPHVPSRSLEAAVR